MTDLSKIAVGVPVLSRSGGPARRWGWRDEAGTDGGETI